MFTQAAVTDFRAEAVTNAGIDALRLLIEVVARACKRIAIAVNKGALGEVMGVAGTENVQGEVQKKLDIISNEVLIEAKRLGLDIGAVTPQEIAVSILAELIAVKHGKMKSRDVVELSMQWNNAKV